jgi:hypothetical protein
VFRRGGTQRLDQTEKQTSLWSPSPALSATRFISALVKGRRFTAPARDLMCEELRRGRIIPSDWRMLIATEDDTILKTIPFFLVAHGGGVPHPPAVRQPIRKVNVEREHPSLAETDRLIAKSRTHIDAQRVRIAILESDGRDTSLANDLLRLLENTFACMIERRRVIVRELSRVDG